MTWTCCPNPKHECRCACHDRKSNGVQHLGQPCCDGLCLTCGIYVEAGMMNEHREVCVPKPAVAA